MNTVTDEIISIMSSDNIVGKLGRISDNCNWFIALCIVWLDVFAELRRSCCAWALVNETPERFVLAKFAFVKFAPVNLAFERFTPDRSAFVKFTDEKLTELHD